MGGAQTFQGKALDEPRRAGPIGEILAERRRQIDVEGYSAEHDDHYRHGQLAMAAASYAVSSAYGLEPENATGILFWPWSLASWKPSHDRRDLVRAGALILAELERLDRAALP